MQFITIQFVNRSLSSLLDGLQRAANGSSNPAIGTSTEWLEMLRGPAFEGDAYREDLRLVVSDQIASG